MFQPSRISSKVSTGTVGSPLGITLHVASVSGRVSGLSSPIMAKTNCMFLSRLSSSLSSASSSSCRSSVAALSHPNIVFGRASFVGHCRLFASGRATTSVTNQPCGSLHRWTRQVTSGKGRLYAGRVCIATHRDLVYIVLVRKIKGHVYKHEN